MPDVNFSITLKRNIEESLQKLEESGGDDIDAVAEATATSLLVPDSHDTSVNRELYELWQLGLLNIFSLKQKTKILPRRPSFISSGSTASCSWHPDCCCFCWNTYQRWP